MNTTTIWKYPIQLADEQIVKLPMGARILSAQFQQDELCLWVLVNATEAEKPGRKIRIYGTGHWIDAKCSLTYISTAQRWPMVWHVFEDTAP